MNILEQALLWHDQGQEVAIATVISTWGSSPRPVGSQMGDHGFWGSDRIGFGRLY